MKDEMRHLQLDGILVELCLDHCRARPRAPSTPRCSRRCSASSPGRRARGSGVKVIRELVRQMPELSWREEEMIDAVLALKHDRAFQRSLFNAAAMPLTFGVFDARRKLATRPRRMVGYDRR